jgi:hypothetical protein
MTLWLVAGPWRSETSQTTSRTRRKTFHIKSLNQVSRKNLKSRPHFGAMRIAPSRRITSPLSMSFSMM